MPISLNVLFNVFSLLYENWTGMLQLMLMLGLLCLYSRISTNIVHKSSLPKLSEHFYESASWSLTRIFASCHVISVLKDFRCYANLSFKLAWGIFWCNFFSYYYIVLHKESSEIFFGCYVRFANEQGCSFANSTSLGSDIFFRRRIYFNPLITKQPGNARNSRTYTNMRAGWGTFQRHKRPREWNRKKRYSGRIRGLNGVFYKLC